MKKVAICDNPFQKKHSTIWTIPWEAYCKENNIAYEIVNPYDDSFIASLDVFTTLLWHYSGYNYTDMVFARNLIYAAKQKGVQVFPDFEENWHFDDKIAQTYLLEAIEAPIPKSYVFYSHKMVAEFLNGNPTFPIVGKLRNGSGAHNVKMLSSSKELLSYSKKMFSSGFSSTPNILYKTTSNVKSTVNLKMFLNRLKRIPEFLNTWRTSKQFPNEKRYVYLQSFVPNDGFDLKVVVVKDKLSFIGRNIRKGDFRASGGGSLFYDKDFIPSKLIEVAFATSDALGFQCMGYDFVINNETGEPIIIEMSYGFSHQALLDANGHYDRQGVWHEIPLNAPKEILAQLLSK